jgi:hypothetical protein
MHSDANFSINFDLELDCISAAACLLVQIILYYDTKRGEGGTPRLKRHNDANFSTNSLEMSLNMHACRQKITHNISYTNELTLRNCFKYM